MPEFDIAEIAAIMHSSNVDGYVDPVSGEVHTRFNDGFYRDDDEDDTADDWIRVDAADTAEEYEDMVDFAEAVTDTPQRVRLLRALEGRGALPRFRDEIHRDGDIGRLWHRFQDARREMRVASWLADSDLIPHEESDVLVAARQATLAEVRRSLARLADAELEAVAARERELQTPECRSDPARVAELLADDFEEVGASGSAWSKADTLAGIAAEASDAPRIHVHDLVTRRVADDVVLVRWTSERNARRAERTSLWRRDDDRWRLVHHQGTPVT
ncbi:MAG: nuclear transport factor 2 family protein [Microbacterium sp.]